MATGKTITINRAPVLALWAAVVAERLGFSRDSALTLRAVAGLNAYSKGVSLGLFEAPSKAVDDHLKKAKRGAALKVDLLHRAVPVVRTPQGLRALSKDRPISPASAKRYFEGNSVMVSGPRGERWLSWRGRCRRRDPSARLPIV